MAATNRQRGEERFEQLLGNLLRAGVLLAAAVVLFGGAVYLVRHGGERPDHKVFHGEPAHLRSPTGIVESAAQLTGRGLIQFGLLLLVATPVARVCVSVVGFLRERDFLYVVLTLIVLAVLLYSLFFGEVL
jgi:uncharacterized membrane protein